MLFQLSDRNFENRARKSRSKGDYTQNKFISFDLHSWGIGGPTQMAVLLIVVGVGIVAGVVLYWDWDGDGLGTYTELVEVDTDFLDPDTDDDTLFDGEEIKMGSDPLKSNTPRADAGKEYEIDEVHNHEEEDRSLELSGWDSRAPGSEIVEYSWEVVNDPTGGTRITNTESATPTFYSPDDVDFQTGVKVKLTVTSDLGLSDSDTSTILIQPFNEPPKIISSDPTSSTPVVEEPNNISFSVQASDEEGHALTYSWGGGASGSGSRWTYEGSWDSDHEDENVSISVTVEDEKGQSTLVSWTMGITDVNRLPSIDMGGPYSVDEDHGSTDYTVKLENLTYSDPEGDDLSYSWKIKEGPGSIEQSGTEPLFSSPSNVLSPTDVIVELTADDGYGEKTETTTVTVRPFNEAPRIISSTPTGFTPSVDEGNNQTFSITAQDEEGSDLSYTWTGNVSGSGSETTYQGSWDSDHEDDELNVNVKVEDSGGKSQNKFWTLTVQDVNRPPEIDLGGPYSVDEDHGLSEKSIALDSTEFSDPEGDSLAYDWKLLDNTYASLSNSDSPTPTFDSVPEVLNSKNIEVEVTVQDGHGGVGRRTCMVRINPYQELAEKYMPTLKHEAPEDWFTCDPAFDGDYNTGNNKNNYNNETFFVHIHQVSHEDKTYIEYWYYYAYNPGFWHDHKNDWELVEVVLSGNRSAIEKVRLGAHGNFNEYEKDEMDYQDRTHPVVYVDDGTHAMDHDKGHIGHSIRGDFGEVGIIAKWEYFVGNPAQFIFLGNKIGNRTIDGNSVAKLEANGYKDRDGLITTRDIWLPAYYNQDTGVNAPWQEPIWNDPDLGGY